MIADIIAGIKKDLYSIPTREQTLKAAVAEKVEHAQELYLRNIEKNFNYLLTKNNLRLLKTIKREQQRKEQEALEAEFAEDEDLEEELENE